MQNDIVHFLGHYGLQFAKLLEVSLGKVELLEPFFYGFLVEVLQQGVAGPEVLTERFGLLFFYGFQGGGIVAHLLFQLLDLVDSGLWFAVAACKCRAGEGGYQEDTAFSHVVLLLGAKIGKLS